MMNPQDERAAQVLSVQTAVSNLIIKLGYDPDVVAEGAMKGAAASLIATGSSTKDVGKVFEDFGFALRDVDEGGAETVN